MTLLYMLEKCAIDLVKLSRDIVEFSRGMYTKWEQRAKYSNRRNIKKQKCPTPAFVSVSKVDINLRYVNPHAVKYIKVLKKGSFFILIMHKILMLFMYFCTIIKNER